jgi:sugar lactone lactonase YvrE
MRAWQYLKAFLLAFFLTASLRSQTTFTFATFAGKPGVSGANDGYGAAAQFNIPEGIIADDKGVLFVADNANNMIRKVTSAGFVSTIAGRGGVAGSADGPGAIARFNYPSGLALDGMGSIYIADSQNHTIRLISAEGVVSTIAGGRTLVGAVDGIASEARFNYPYGMVFDKSGTLYVTDHRNSTIRKMIRTGSNWTVSTLAGSPGMLGSANGLGSNARFNRPSGISLDQNENLIVVDTYNHTIRKVTRTGVVTTVAGSAGKSGSTDASGALVRFTYPRGITVDANGIFYIGDAYNNRIRMMTQDGVVRTIGGNDSTGSADGVGGTARFNHPFGITVDALGTLYILDQINNTIRKGWITGTLPVLQLIASNPADGQVQLDVIAQTVSVSSINLFEAKTLDGLWMALPPEISIETNVPGFSYSARISEIEPFKFIRAQGSQ